MAFLNAPQTLRLLRDLQRHLEQSEQVEQLLGLIEYNLGYHLYRSYQVPVISAHAPIRGARWT